MEGKNFPTLDKLNSIFQLIDTNKFDGESGPPLELVDLVSRQCDELGLDMMQKIAEIPKISPTIIEKFNEKCVRF